jgi:ppGpp synthetase/RelA/SpoT-type nucleotidyltranferase
VRHTPGSVSYEEATAALVGLAAVVDGALRPNMSGVVLHDITSRIKSRESSDRKILAFPDEYKSYGDLHDLLGIRVVTLFEDDLDAAEVAIRKVLKIDARRSGDKFDRYQPNEFGYRSRHFVGSLRANRAKLPENQLFAGRVVEVQLRSLLQHVWAEVEHDLGYKPGRPLDLANRRRFSQLAALMELADQSFSTLRSELTTAESAELEGSETAPEASLSIATLDAFVRKDAKFKAFDRNAALRLESTLSPTGSAMRERIGYLVDLCSTVGWQRVSDVAAALEEHRDAALRRAERGSQELRELLEMPVGDGLRPGFGIILLAEAAKDVEER